MARPPADLDPEKFIIGRGLYDNLTLAQAYHDDEVFRIDPVPMPVASLVLHNVLFVAFFCAFGYAMHGSENYERSSAIHRALWDGVVGGIGLMTCAVYTLFTWHQVRQAQELGPWLICERHSGIVHVPREKVRFERGEVVHVQYITTKRLDEHPEYSQLSELNLITVVDGMRHRWPLLRSISCSGAFDGLLQELIEVTGLPAVRVKDTVRGWKTTEVPIESATRKA
jgi:hypothetical protein